MDVDQSRTHSLPGSKRRTTAESEKILSQQDQTKKKHLGLRGMAPHDTLTNTKTSELKRNVQLSLPGMVGWPERVDQVWIQAVFPAFSTSPFAVETLTMMIMGL